MVNNDGLERAVYCAGCAASLALPLVDIAGLSWLLVPVAWPAIVLGTICIAAAFVLASVQCARALVRRRPLRSLPYLGMLLLIPAGFVAGIWLSKAIPALVCAPRLHAAIADVKDGKTRAGDHLPLPIHVLQTNPDVASYAQLGPLFLAQYVVYDEADRTGEAVALRVREKLDGSACAVWAQTILGHYYWVSEAC